MADFQPMVSIGSGLCLDVVTIAGHLFNEAGTAGGCWRIGLKAYRLTCHPEHVYVLHVPGFWIGNGLRAGIVRC